MLAAAALVYTQYFGLLFVGVQQLAFAVARRARRDCAAARACWRWAALLVLLALPLAPFALDQFAANEAGRHAASSSRRRPAARSSRGAAPGAYAALTNAAWAVLGYHSNATMTALAALWPLAAAARARAARPRPLVADAAGRRLRRRAGASRCSRSAS